MTNTDKAMDLAARLRERDAEAKRKAYHGDGDLLAREAADELERLSHLRSAQESQESLLRAWAEDEQRQRYKAEDQRTASEIAHLMGSRSSDSWLEAFDATTLIIAQTLASFRLGLDVADPYAFNEDEKLKAGIIAGTLDARHVTASQLTPPTPDQIAYLKEIDDATGKYNPSTIVGGPKPQASQETLTLPDGTPLPEFKPCVMEQRELGITTYIHEDVAYVAHHVGKPEHYVDALLAMDDNRLVGVNFWWCMPEKASPAPLPSQESLVERAQELSRAKWNAIGTRLRIHVRAGDHDGVARIVQGTIEETAREALASTPPLPSQEPRVILWKGEEITPELEAEARRVCLSQCRAKLCVDAGQCANSWPGDGSGAWFDMHFPRARASMAKGTQEARIEAAAKAMYDNVTLQRAGKPVPTLAWAEMPADAKELARTMVRAAIAAADRVSSGSVSFGKAGGFQRRVLDWMIECFSMEIARDGTERNHRFLEEALELVQSLGCTRSEAHQLVDYTFNKPAGDPKQELGGVMVTIAALCFPNDLDMMEAAEAELVRVWQKIDIIRAKQAAKPKHSPLPTPPPASEGG